MLGSWTSLRMLRFKHPFENLNRICILLLCKNYMDLNYVELVHGDFQVSCFLLLLYIHFINFGEFDIETPTENLNLSTFHLSTIYFLLVVIYSGTVCNFVVFSKSPVKCYHSFII